jgi:hypothetical protein
VTVWNRLNLPNDIYRLDHYCRTVPFSTVGPHILKSSKVLLVGMFLFHWSNPEVE